MVIHVKSSCNLRFQMRLCIVIYNVSSIYGILVVKLSFMPQVNSVHFLHLCFWFLSISSGFCPLSFSFLNFKVEVKRERGVWVRVRLVSKALSGLWIRLCIVLMFIAINSLSVVDKNRQVRCKRPCSLLLFRLWFSWLLFSLSFLNSFRKFSK